MNNPNTTKSTYSSSTAMLQGACVALFAVLVAAPVLVCSFMGYFGTWFATLHFQVLIGATLVNSLVLVGVLEYLCHFRHVAQRTKVAGDHDCFWAVPSE